MAGSSPAMTIRMRRYSVHGTPQHRDHRACRPRQDDAGRPAAAPERRVPRQPAGRRARPGFERPGARARHHDPGQMHLGRLAGTCGSTSSTRRATPISAARSSASSAWSTACCVLVDAAEGPMPQTKFVLGKALAPRPAADRRDQQGRPPRRARRARCTTRSSTCSRRSTPTRQQLDFPTLFASGRDGWAATDARRAAQGPGAAVRPDRRACAAARRPMPTRRSRCWRRRSSTTRISAAC